MFPSWCITFSKKVVILIIAIALIAPIVLISTPVLAADPTVVTGTAVDTTDSSTTLWGELSSIGDYTGTYIYLSFDYCTDAYYDAYSDYDRETTEIEWESDNGITSFATDLEGLVNATIYHYRAKVRFGTSYVYGLDAEFTTSFVVPDDTPSIHFFKAYKDLLETDDCLFVILGEIPYYTIPGIPVSRAYYYSILDLGTEVGWNTGYAMNDNGYNFNIYSLYFDAATGIDWGNVTDYTLELHGSPDIFSGTVPSWGPTDDVNYGVYADTWVDATDYSEALADDLLDIASTLEQEWQIVLLDEQDTKTVLSSNGEKLFRNAIPGVQMMAPSIFFIQRGDMDVTERNWGTSQSDSYKERLLGVDGEPGGGDDNWALWGLVAMADWINVPFLLLIAMFCLLVCILVIWQSLKRFKTPVPGYIASISVILCFSLLAMGLTALGIIGLALVIVVGWLLFMRRG